MVYIALQSHSSSGGHGVSQQQHSGRRKAYNAIIAIATNEYDTSFGIELLQTSDATHQTIITTTILLGFLSLHKHCQPPKPEKNELTSLKSRTAYLQFHHKQNKVHAKNH